MTTISVTTKVYILLHIHTGLRGVVTMACDSGLRGLGYGPRLLWRGAVSLGKTLHLHVHALDPGVNEYQIEH